MALPSSHLNPRLLSNSSPLFSISYVHPQRRNTFPFNCRTLKFEPIRSRISIETETQQPQRIKIDSDGQREKKKRKPRPSFNVQIREKWSVKPVSRRVKFPWEVQEESIQGLDAVGGEEGKGTTELSQTQLKNNGNSAGFTQKNCDNVNQIVSKGKVRETQIASVINAPQECRQKLEVVVDAEEEVEYRSKEIEGVSVAKSTTSVHESLSGPGRSALKSGSVLAPWVNRNRNQKPQLLSWTEIDRRDGEKNENDLESCGNTFSMATDADAEKWDFEEDFSSSSELEEAAMTNERTAGSFKGEAVPFDGDCYYKGGENVASLNEMIQYAGVESPDLKHSAERLPWVADRDSENAERESYKRSHTESAEKMIPEHELKRLRNISLRMMERIKVGAADISQALVGTVHDKWKIDEVVKLKFEGPPALNMKRTHEMLERKTGGLVIWRSGSSVVLYRGISYNLECVQSYSRQNRVSEHPAESSLPGSSRFLKNLSEEELMDFSELNNLLGELGPRFVDWSGCDPLPVDADLLPGFIPGYKTPCRLLPHGIRSALRDKETTYFRRLARKTPPHFALGKNRELQGLAAAMVKLWEKCAIAKIAIKRGVLNTCNERMAEQLKQAFLYDDQLSVIQRLTGGVLLSRNKEYIVFYRGNDFLPPAVVAAVNEREQLSVLQHQEEEARRVASDSMNLNYEVFRGEMVAGTLAETVEATSRWGKQPSDEDVKKMVKDSALDRHAALVRYLEKKLALAKGKLEKAEKALAKVQESLEPAELPTDLETITDEERFLLRKIGSSMKPFLLLGRRGLFDGTVESMHLHWKYREVVKIIVKEKNFAQVKHIAVSLEAESGGVLVSVDKTTKGYAIIVYRGKNYQQPLRYKPKNLLTKRQALARSIELQRREALKHHIFDLQERIALVKSELEDMKMGRK